tara:strand:+ start:2060 stop:2374 length:315 start_codon:yes stop_codon:yes gene_type:complete
MEENLTKEFEKEYVGTSVRMLVNVNTITKGTQTQDLWVDDICTVESLDFAENDISGNYGWNLSVSEDSLNVNPRKNVITTVGVDDFEFVDYVTEPQHLSLGIYD